MAHYRSEGCTAELVVGRKPRSRKHNHTKINRMKGKIFICSSLVLVAMQLPAAERQSLHGHVPPSISQLAPMGRLPASNSLVLAIGLPLRNTNELAALLKAIYDPASTQFRHYLTPEQFTDRFGPTEHDYQALIAFANANGLKVTGTHPNRMVVDVAANVSDIETAFHVNLRTYQHPKEARTFYAPDAEPSLALTVPVLHISGLDSFVLPRPMIVKQASVKETRTPSGVASSSSVTEGGNPAVTNGSGPNGAY